MGAGYKEALWNAGFPASMGLRERQLTRAPRGRYLGWPVAKQPQEKLCLECERVFQSEKMRCPYDGTKLVRFGSGLPAGSVIDNRYTIERMVGAGGMGSVYLARQHAMDRPVALKILHPRLGEDRSAAQRFNVEVRATARLRSPHTITVHDFGQTERGSLYLAMEYLEGRPSRRSWTTRARWSRTARSASRCRSARAWPRRTTRASSTAT